MDSNDLQEYWNTLDHLLERNKVTSDADKVAMLQAQIMLVQVEQLEKLNEVLRKIENTLRHNMEVAVIQP